MIVSNKYRIFLSMTSGGAATSIWQRAVGTTIVALAASWPVSGGAGEFHIEVGLPPNAPRPTLLTGAAEQYARKGVAEVARKYSEVRKANLTEPFYQRGPLSDSKEAWARIRALAKNLGLDPRRVIVTGEGSELIPTAGSAGDFLFFHERVALNAPEAVLSFLLAHEWAHIEREHVRKLYQLYYWESVAACLRCVQQQLAAGDGVIGVSAAAHRGEQRHTWGLVGRWMELEADLAAAYRIQKLGGRVPVDAVFDYFRLELGVNPDETLSHPGFDERKFVIRMAEPTW